MLLVRGQLLLLLAATIIARSHCARGNTQWTLQERGQDKTPRLLAAELYNLLGFKHGPLYEWLPALLDQDATREGEQLDTGLDLASSSENESVLQDSAQSDLLLSAVEPSVWRKRRRRLDEQSSGALSLCRAARPCAGDSSADREVMTSATTPSQLYGRTGQYEKTERRVQHSKRGGRINSEADGMQTKIRQGPHNEDYIFNSWDSQREPAVGGWGWKRAIPSSGTVGTARRRAFSSWGGKRAPAFHSWGGKKRSEEGSAFTVAGSKRRPVFGSWGGKRDSSFNSLGDKRNIFAFSILSSGDEPAFRMWGSESAPPFSILNPKKDTVFSGLDAKSDPALRILGKHEYPEFSILRSNYKPKPALNFLGSKRAFSSWGGKRNTETPELEHNSEYARGAQLSTWGGKRGFDGEERETRSSSSWGGKQNLISGGMKEDVQELGKRRFSSWGGKRDTTQTEEIGPGNEEEQSSADEDRKDASTKTSSAEGYRQLLEEFGRKMKLVHDNNNEVKGNPEETGGGENSQSSESEEEDQRQLDGQNATESAITKRSEARARVSKALFGPWGGKRSHVPPASLFSVLGRMHSVGGSRLLSELFNKRGHARSETPGSKKWGPSPAGTVFSSWGGKRSDKLVGRNMPKTQPQGSGRQYRRGADFYSWGGKR